jgi:hypothetical protein
MRQREEGPALPPAFAEACARKFKKQQLKWLISQAGIARTSAALSAAGVRHEFLKGATLCLSAYPRAEIRPLRDLDILVEPAAAIAARHALLELGFESFFGDVEKAIQSGYQQPALYLADAKLVVELHHDLAVVQGYESAPLAAYLLDTAKLHVLANVPIPVCSPTGAFLHLVMHAGIKSQFDCGPLLLSDLTVLIDADPAALENLDQVARQFGLSASLALFTQLLERHAGRGLIPVAMSGTISRAPADLLDHVEKLLVHPARELRKRQMARLVVSEPVKLRALLHGLRRALRPSRSGIAAVTGRKDNDDWLWTRYPRWLFHRGAQFLAGASTVVWPTTSRSIGRWLGGY